MMGARCRRARTDTAGARSRRRGRTNPAARVRAFASTRGAEPRGAAAGARCAGRDPRACARRCELPRQDAWRPGCARSGWTPSATCSSTCRATAARRARWRRCAPGEQATVAVEVRRSPRARCAAAACARWSRRPSSTPAARCARRSSTSPGCVERYPPGTRLLLHGKADGRGGFGVSHHAPRRAAPVGEAAGGAAPPSGAVAHYPATEGVSSTQILTLVQGRARRSGDVARAAAGAPRASRERPARPRERARRDALPARRRASSSAARGGWPSRSCCSRSCCSCAAAPAAQRARGAPTLLDEPPTLTERWLAAGAAVRAHRRSAARDRGDRRGPGSSARRCSGC